MKAIAYLCALLVISGVALGDGFADLRKERDRLSEGGMWRELIDLYEGKLIEFSDEQSAEDLRQAFKGVGKLNAWGEFDALVERAVETHPENAMVLMQAGLMYQQAQHIGRIVGGEFERADRNGVYRMQDGKPAAGQVVQTAYRDRVRSVQLYLKALPHADDDGKFMIWNRVAGALQTGASWKLQSLTDLAELPDWGDMGPEGGTEGAPWLVEGPLLFGVPESWDAAANDGERWRFALAEQARLKPDHAADVTVELARFFRNEFGVQTLAGYGWWRGRDADEEKGVLAVHTLAEDECLAKTSDGVRRFKLPADEHFIAMYRSVMDERDHAGDELVEVFLNRRQFVKAREVLERVIAKHGPGYRNQRKKRLEQITGNWGRFEVPEPVPAGERPQVPLVFRNGHSVALTAAPVDVDELLGDVISYLKSNPKELDWQRIQFGQIGSRLIREKKSKYVGEVVERWVRELEPRKGHADARAMVEVPVDEAGAWWITGKMEGGDEFHALAWVVDSVLVTRGVGGREQWWLVDAGSGAPVADAKLEYFGYRRVQRERKIPLGRRQDILTKEFEKGTDAEGKVLLKPGDADSRYQWLAMARKGGKLVAFSGYRGIHINPVRGQQGTRDMSYGLSDRPLYKPGNTAHLKFFLRNVGYDGADEDKWAGKVGSLVVRDGHGGEVVKVEKLKTDELGAVEAEVVLPKEGALGGWHAVFSISNRMQASVSFRVEEYRKPEYEVTVEAPDEPVRLGEKFEVKVVANYFHGAPVRNAEVEVIVKRASMGEKWFPAWRWDWLYGRGAWWLGETAAWHPGWDRWCCIPPNPPWWRGNRWTPEELVMKRELAIGPDGTVTVEVDTALTKEIHGDMDARFNVEARVVDASRREERGTGSVIAARRPFEVVLWMDRGHVSPGNKVVATVEAATLAGKPVAGAKGRLVMYRLSMDDGGLVGEKEVKAWDVVTDAEGRVRQEFAAPEAGQYRLAAELAHDGGEMVENGVVFAVFGEGRVDPDEWRFGPLELVADKSEYAPGETVKLRVNSDRENADVWVFLRAGMPAAEEAKLVKLDGKSREIEVPVELADMPNVFIEGVTVHGARVHTAVRQILLPPVSKLVEVTLEPAKERVKPGEESALRVTLRDEHGDPVSGTAVLAVYDKALEAITGGSNVGPVREAFWKWQNHYYGGRISGSVPAAAGGLVREGMERMGDLGIFAYAGIAGEADADAFGAVREAGDFIEAAPMMMRSKSMAAAPTNGLRSGDFAITRNSIDAILNNPDGRAEIVVRKDFADLLKWAGEVEVGADGSVEIPLEFPDNLTTWKARVWTLLPGTRVGEGTAEIVASKDLLVRLQAPRFLVERDEAVLSAVVHNDHGEAKSVTVSLELDGGELELVEGGTRTVEIAARSEARVDWRVKALKEGEAVVRMKADAGDDGDAVERKLPVLVHGMSRQDAWSRAVGPDEQSARIVMQVPDQRRPDQTKLTVRFSPTVAGAVVDAIPYLADYPHGCTEQTLNRFVPAVIAQKMLKDLDLSLDEVRAKRNNLNPQELGDAGERAAQWKRWQRNPVFDEVELEKMVEQGVSKLMDMQNFDGGWGWFSGYQERSWPHTTAVVVHGLLVAKAHGAEVPERMLDAGVTWLAEHEKTQVAGLQRWVEREAERKAGKEPKETRKLVKRRCDAMDAFTRMVLGESGLDSEPMLAFLYRDRVELPVYAKCLVGLEQHRVGDEARRDELIRLVSQFQKRDEENQTSYLELPNDGYWWFWYGSRFEAHAWYLKLLAAAKPDDEDTRGLVKYLVNNRKHATYWDSTRDTAYAVEAIAAYFKASGEDAPEMEVEVLVDGKPVRKVKIDRENLFSFDGTVELTGEAVSGGDHVVELRKTGRGTLYANAYLEVFTLEDKLRAAGLEVKVARKVWKLVPLEDETEVPDETGLVVKQKVEKFERIELKDGDAVKSGERIEVELILESKNDYEYLVFSDAKAAGFEAVEALSGYVPGGLGVYMEPRDETVDFFIRRLPRGTQTLRYQLRAETPGMFKALPATAEAMYAPELRGNSEDIRLGVDGGEL